MYKIESIILTDSDKAIFQATISVAQAVAAIFGKNCEVIIHSFEDFENSIIHIENGDITGRKVGDALGSVEQKILEEICSSEGGEIESYFHTTVNGRTFKSITSPIENNSGKTIGLFCINVDLSVPAIELIENMLPKRTASSVNNHSTSFSVSISRLVKKSLDEAIDNINSKRKIAPSDKNKMVVNELYRQEIFAIKGAIDIVASEIGVSRFTIYSYIRDIKSRTKLQNDRR